MDQWLDAIQFLIPALTGMIAVYTLAHMGINWLRGRDIIEGLFVFKWRKKKRG